MAGSFPDLERTTPASADEGVRRILQSRAIPSGAWAENPLPAAAGGGVIGERIGRFPPCIGRFAPRLPVALGRETIISPSRLRDRNIRPGQPAGSSDLGAAHLARPAAASGSAITAAAATTTLVHFVHLLPSSVPTSIPFGAGWCITPLVPPTAGLACRPRRLPAQYKGDREQSVQRRASTVWAGDDSASPHQGIEPRPALSTAILIDRHGSALFPAQTGSLFAVDAPT
jgi:hypothetical protein